MRLIEQAAKEALAQNPDAEVMSIISEGKKYWVKRARKSGSRAFHRVAYGLLGHPLLVPSLPCDPSGALAHETGKLVRLAQKEIHVPKVVTQQNTFFVLEDQGSSVLNAIRNGEVSDANGVLEKVIALLASLHVKGEFHGGAQIKNFTCKDEKVFAIDFEEAFDGAIPVADLQFRDLFLFLFSLAKHGIEADYAALIGLYEKQVSNGASQRMRALARNLGWLTRLAHTGVMQKVLDQDSKSAFRLLRILGALEMKEKA